jgi:hypothetical protein
MSKSSPLTTTSLCNEYHEAHDAMNNILASENLLEIYWRVAFAGALDTHSSRHQTGVSTV